MLGAPPVVKQDATDLCWAAALESWLTVVPGRGWASQDELRKRYGKPKAKEGEESTGPEGGLDPLTWPAVAQAFQIQYRVVEGSDLQYLWRLVYSKLQKGHVLILFPLQSGAGHTHVIWGIDQDSSGEFVYSVMDPNSGDLSTRQDRFYTLRKQVVVAWPDTNVNIPATGP
jgi:hypothetical protein